MKKERIGIIGLGLIGGSIALALGRDYDVVGYDTDSLSCEYAVANGICKIASPEAMRGFAAVFVCVPIAAMSGVLAVLPDIIGDTIITDVASVKLPYSSTRGRYVGGHPMAGTERGGIKSAKAHLFQNAYWCITDKGGDAEAVSALVEHMGAKPVYISAAEHDRTVGAFSHTPHAVAYALVEAAFKCTPAPIAGTGFIDTTRIAQSSGEFWSEVFRLNKLNIMDGIDSVRAELDTISAFMAADDYAALCAYMNSARQKREALNRHDFGGETLYVDLVDRIGEFERVTGAIAAAGINVADIALVPGREGASGALRLEFDSAADREKAEKVLAAPNDK